MKIEISRRDRMLLIVSSSVLILVVLIRLAILPAIDAYEAGKIEYAEKCAQAEEMQRRMDEYPANERRIIEGLDRLDELSGFCYETMENRQVDELVTGVALDHDLFPSHLSISEQTEGIRMPYLYSAGMLAADSETESGETDNSSDDEETRITENPEETEENSENGQAAEPSDAAAEGAIRKVEASISMRGNEKNMRAFLDDIEENYPALHVKSFQMSENLYLNTELQTVTEVQMNAVLEIYMHSKPEGR